MLNDYIQKNRILLEKHIDTFFENKKKSIPPGLNTFTETINHLQTIVPKGKLLRGIQILMAYEMTAGKLSEEAFNAAAALEIMQAGVLIQDDFMDNDYTRRGQRSVFAQFYDAGKTQGTVNPLLYGQSMATCVGDIAYFLAFELLNTTNNSIILQSFSREWQLVGAGQMMDVDFSSRNYEPTEKEVMTIYTYKTARYSFSLPLSIGAILGKADTSMINALDMVGEKMGILFQIKDDELGLFGDEKQLGKPIGSDIRENKKTLIRALLYQKATENEKKQMTQIFGKPDISENNIDYIKQLVKKYSVLESLYNKVDKMKKAINASIEELSITENYQSLLKELVVYISTRSQ